MAVCLLVPSAGNGADDRRGGNHGCDNSTGEFYSDHFFEPGDNISFGFRVESISFPSSTSDNLRAQNTSSEGGTASTLSCGGDPGAWKVASSNLGAGDDSVRMDAKGIEVESGEDPFVALPKSIQTSIRGGAGDDVLRGHKGFDNLNAGSGDDVIKADDGKRDIVSCGSGKDKADVDKKDDVSRCEKLT
jgi:Ca2+-binding RTX toxin-like protein